jgi:hypothetical protein
MEQEEGSNSNKDTLNTLSTAAIINHRIEKAGHNNSLP